MAGGSVVKLSNAPGTVIPEDIGFIDSAFDLDDVTTSMACAWSGTNKGYVSNKPFDDAGAVFAFKMGPSSNRRIMMIAVNTSNMYVRFGYGNSWGNWMKLN